MSGLLQGKANKDNISVKRFGYLLSSLFLILTVISMLAESVFLPWLFLITMYFVSGSLWLPALIKPLYRVFGRFIPLGGGMQEISEKNSSNENEQTNR